MLPFFDRCGKPGMPSPATGSGVPPFHLAVPEKRFALTHMLPFFDRCGKPGMPSPATGSGIPPFLFEKETKCSIESFGA